MPKKKTKTKESIRLETSQLINTTILSGFGYLAGWAIYNLFDAMFDYFIPEKTKKKFPIRYYICYTIIMFSLLTLAIVFIPNT